MKFISKLENGQTIQSILEECLVRTHSVKDLAGYLGLSRQSIYQLLKGRQCTYAVSLRILNLFKQLKKEGENLNVS